MAHNNIESFAQGESASQSSSNSQVISRYDNRNPFCTSEWVRRSEPEACALPPCPEGWTMSGDFCEFRAYQGPCPEGQTMSSSSGNCVPEICKTGTSSSSGTSSSGGANSIPVSNIPMDPHNGGRSIDTSALQIGDIILSTTDQLPSKLIRFATDSPVSHSMLYVGNGQVIEAVGNGVRLVPIETALADSNFAVAVRYPGLTHDQAQKIVDYARQQLGKPYDYRHGVVGQALFRLDLFCGEPLEKAGRINLGTGTNDKWFCSELVLASFVAAGVTLTTTPPSWTAPGDIIPLVLNGKLEYVGHLKT